MTTVNSEMLTVARESRGRTQAEVAEAIGVTQGLISKAEDGTKELSVEKLDALARFLRYPAALFYEQGRVREVGSTCLYHRKRKTLPKKIINRLDAQMFIRNVNVRRLLDGLDIEGDRTFHTLDADEFGGSSVDVARALRAAWRVPDGPIPNLTALIESAGGIVLMEDFGHRKLFGISCWTTRGHPLFLLNSEISTADLRWTLAHELGHLTMHHVPTNDPEREADEFAGEFLAPAATFKPHLRGLTFDRLANLKAYWKLTMKGVIKRAQTLGAIDPQTATRLYKQHSARGYNTIEPYPVPDEPPTLVHEAINIRLGEHEYSTEELAASVLLNRDEFYASLLGQPPPEANVIPLFGSPSPAASA